MKITKILLYMGLSTIIVFWLLFFFVEDVLISFLVSLPHNVGLWIVLFMVLFTPFLIIYGIMEGAIRLGAYSSKVVRPHISLLKNNRDYRISFIAGLFVGLIFLGVSFLMDLVEYIVIKLSLEEFVFIKYLAGFVVLIYIMDMANRVIEGSNVDIEEIEGDVEREE